MNCRQIILPPRLRLLAVLLRRVRRRLCTCRWIVGRVRERVILRTLRGEICDEVCLVAGDDDDGLSAQWDRDAARGSHEPSWLRKKRVD